MKQYTKYITKKDSSFITCQGNTAFIPKDTVCQTDDKGFILFENEIICYKGSRNAAEFFWGYDENNPEEDIKRQELREKVIYSKPVYDLARIRKEESPWNKYGFIFLSSGEEQILWGWEEWVLESDIDVLENILKNIENKTFVNL